MPTRLLLTLILVLCWNALGAQERGSALYRGEATVAGADETARAQALREALMRVLIKLTGRPDAMQQPGMVEALAQAPRLAARVGYRQQFEGEAVRDVLIADFDPDGVNVLLAKSGLVIWPEPRPTPVLWLAIDDGRGPRLVTSSQGAAVASLREAGAARGLRFLLPEGAAEEENFGLQAAWRDDPEAAEALRSRYPGAVQLLGRLYRSEGGWRGEWTLREHDEALRHWSDAGPDARALMAGAADTAADVLAGRFSELMAAGPPGVFTVRIEGINSADDYPRVMAYLGSLGPVRRATPILADDRGLTLELDLAVGLEGFRRLVGAGPVLGEAGDAGDMPLFRVRR